MNVESRCFIFCDCQLCWEGVPLIVATYFHLCHSTRKPVFKLTVNEQIFCVLTLTDCVNNGLVNVSARGEAGGFIGSLTRVNKEVTFSNCQNNGTIQGRGVAGGFFGFIGDSSGQIRFSNCVNKGTVRDAFGDIGPPLLFDNDITTNSMAVHAMSNEKTDDVSAYYGTACGFFCADENVNSAVVNSINNGTVNSSKVACGITNTIAFARNVASMGNVSGPRCYSFWPEKGDVNMFYGLSGKCDACSHERMFEQNINTGFYDIVNGNDHVHDLLNDEALSKGYGMVWTSKLELVDALPLVKVRGVFERLFAVETGISLEMVGNLSNYLENEDYGVVKSETKDRVVYNTSSTVSGNMSVIVGKWVNISVSEPKDTTERFVIGETLEQVARSIHFSFDEFVVKNGDHVLNPSSTIEENMVLTLCHNVVVSGNFSGQWVVKHGTQLGEITDLSERMKMPYIVYDSKDSRKVFYNYTPVEHHINAVVTSVDKQDIIIWFDEIANVTPDTIKNAISDLVDTSNNEHLWIEVASKDDGSFVVSVMYTEDSNIDLANTLKECSSLNH